MKKIGLLSFVFFSACSQSPTVELKKAYECQRVNYVVGTEVGDHVMQGKIEHLLRKASESENMMEDDLRSQLRKQVKKELLETVTTREQAVKLYNSCADFHEQGKLEK